MRRSELLGQWNKWTPEIRPHESAENLEGQQVPRDSNERRREKHDSLRQETKVEYIVIAQLCNKQVHYKEEENFDNRRNGSVDRDELLISTNFVEVVDIDSSPTKAKGQTHDKHSNIEDYNFGI